MGLDQIRIRWFRFFFKFYLTWPASDYYTTMSLHQYVCYLFTWYVLKCFVYYWYAPKHSYVFNICQNTSYVIWYVLQYFLCQWYTSITFSLLLWIKYVSNEMTFVILYLMRCYPWTFASLPYILIPSLIETSSLVLDMLVTCWAL